MHSIATSFRSLVLLLGCVSLLAGHCVEIAAQDLAPPALRPLVRAHAHNDYDHPRPLLDALEQGFCSVEADVFLRNGQLQVGHSLLELRPERTLRVLYLQPLLERVRANGGRVYPNGPPFTLMIDFKSAAEPTYQALVNELQPFQEMLSCVTDGDLESRAVTIVLSGNRPVETVRAEKTRWVAIDGRTSDLDSTDPAHFMPWISDSWSKLFRWNGQGAMPAEERARLRQFVARAHQRGRRLRLWGAPDRLEVWRELAAADVDLINTDNLAGLATLLRSRGED